MQKFSREFKTAIFGLSILGISSALLFYGYGWFITKQVRVANGIAKPTFPYNDYGRDELESMYPQVANENVATTRTPEVTHKMFVEKLKVGDLNGAVECCVVKGEWQTMKDGLVKVKVKGELDEMVRDLDVRLEKNFLGDTLSSYDYSVNRNGKDVIGNISFEKNRDGIWLIKSF